VQLRGLEPVAAADGCHLEVEGGMPGVAALVHQVLRRTVALPDLDQGPVAHVVLAEVGTQPALAFFDLLHALLRG
jgi:hypothetical protein